MLCGGCGCETKARCATLPLASPPGAAQKALQRKRSESYLNCGKEAEIPSLTEDQNSAPLLRCGEVSLPPVPSSLLQIFSNCPLPGIGETEKKRQEGPYLQTVYIPVGFFFLLIFVITIFSFINSTKLYYME